MCKLVQRLLLLAAMMVVPWVTNAQLAQDYTLSTGVDSTKWITLSSSATTINAFTDEDDETSGCINIGFTFTFAGQSYTQFSCNTNGRFRLGSAACSYYWQLPFTTLTDPSNNDLPFITALGMDVTFESTGTYAKYELVGTAPNRMLVVEYHTATTYDDEDGYRCTYQMQLLEGSNKVRLVYGTTDDSYFDDYQIGIAASANDYLMISPTTHAVTTAGTSTYFNSWPGAYRYYELTPFLPPCPRVSSLYASNVTPTSADLTWSDSGNGISWLIEYSTTSFTPGDGTATTVVATDTAYTLSSLNLGTTYYVAVRAICASDSSTYAQLTFTTPFSMPATVPYYCSFEDAGDNGWDLINGTQTNYWMVGTGAANGGSQGLYVTNNGSANSYTISSTSYVFATRTFNLNDTGEYGYSFDWKCQGESSYDFIRAALVPASTDITAGEYNGFNNSSAVPTGGIALDGAQRLNLVSTWQTRSGTFHITTPGTYMWVFMWRNDLSGGTQPPAAIDNVRLTHNTCPQVSNLTASNITSSSVTLSWTAGSSETMWIVSDGTNLYPTTATTYTITGLQANTEYSLNVAPVCSGADTGMFTNLQVRTACGTLDEMPFFEDFEQYATGSSTNSNFITCWNRLNNGTQYYGYPYLSATSSYNHTPGGSKGFYWANSITTGTYGDYQVMILPPIDTALFSINNLQLSFWAKSSSTGYNVTFQVGVMTDPTDVTTFTQVGTVTVGGNTAWTEYTTSLASYTGTGCYIAVKAVRPTSTWYAYVDDFTVDRIPDCPAVSDIVVSRLTDTGFTLSWTEEGDATAWTVEYGPEGFTHGSGTTVTVTSTTYALTGLTPSTEYQVYVTPVCDSGYAGTDFIVFTTACPPMDSLPYFEDFESYATGSSTNSVFIPCWQRLNNGTQYFGYPYLSSTSSYNHTPGGTKGLYWYNNTTTGTYGDYQCIVLPAVDTTLYPINTLQFTFWARATGASYHPELQVGVMTDPVDITTFQPVDTVAVEGTTYARYDVQLNNFVGAGAYVAVKAVRPSSSWYITVDDFTLDLMPTCLRVSDLEVTQVATDEVTLNWHENGSATEWSVSYYEGTMLTTLTAYDTTFTVSGLSANTNYTFTVRALCGGTDSSDASTVSVRTECNLLDSLPYVDSFESYAATSSTSPDFIPCWHHLNNGTSSMGYPYLSSSSTYNHTSGGTKGLYWYNSTTMGTYGDYQCLVLPGVDTSIYQINTLQLRFWAKSSSSSYNVTFQVGVMTDPNDINTFQQVGTVNVGGNTIWEEYITSLENFEGYGNYVALKAVRPSSSWYAYVDDFTLKMNHICPEMDNLAVNEELVSSSAAYVTWNTRGGMVEPSEFELEYGVEGSSDSPNTVTTTDYFYALIDLEPGTTYKVRVRTSCYDGSYGEWDSVVFMTRPLACVQFDASTLVNAVMGTGTSQTTGVPVNSSWGNTQCQSIYLASELIAAGFHSTGDTITDITYTWTNNSTYAKEFTIYMTNSTQSTYSGTSSSNWVPTGATAMVYSGSHPVNTSGAVTYHLTTPFYWDGTSNLVITTTMNQPTGISQSSSGFYGYSTSGSGTRTMYAYRDSNPYDGSNPSIVSGSNTSSYRPSITLRSATCTEVASCVAPVIRLSNIDNGEVEISWLPGYDETSWTLQYRRGTGGWITEQTGYSSTSYTFTGLTPAVTYEFRVGAECTDGNEYSSLTLTIPCLPMAVPFTEDFETFSSTAADPLPVCWDKHTNYSTNYPYASTSYNHSSAGAGKSMYMYSTASTYSYMVLPLMQPAIDSLEVSFWLYKSNSSYTHALQVGIMTDPTDLSTFQQVAVVTPSVLSQWEFFAVPLNTYTGNGQYIAILSPNGVSSYPYLDDLTVDYIPTCPRVTDVSSRYPEGADFTLYWSANTDATEYLVEYGPQGFPQGFGTMLSTSDDSIRMYGLASMTAYDFYVSAVCSTGDTSPVTIYTYTTPCGSINVLPFRETFETRATGTSTSAAFIDCWHHLNNGTSSMGYPYISSTSSYNHTLGGTKGLYWYASTTTGTYGDYQYVVLPPIDTTIFSMNSLQFSFWAKSTSSSYNVVLYTGVMTDPTDPNSFTPVDTLNIGGNTLWDEYVSTLENFTGVGRYLAIKAVRPTSTWYCNVDDIKVEVIPDCPAVSNMMARAVTPTSASVVWTEEEYATSWTIEYGPAGFLLGTGIQMTATDDSVNISGLLPNTQYEVYVTPDCSAGVGGINSFIFSTACEYFTELPFTEDFESQTTGSSSTGSVFLPCWTRLNNGTSYGGYPYVSSTSSYNHTVGGTKGLYWYNTTTTGTYGDYQYLVLPGIDTNEHAINTLQLSFWAKATSTSYNPVLEVGVMSDPSDINSFQNVTTINVGNSTQWNEYLTTFEDFIGSGNHLAIKATRSTATWYVCVDDIKVEGAPDCPRVENIEVSNITESSVDVSWTEMGEATQWDVVLVQHGMTPEPDSAVTVYTESYSFTGLIENTVYDIYITTGCDEGVGGTNSITFQTDCLPIAHEDMPYVEDFEAYTASTSGTIDPCWRKGNLGVANYYPYVSSSYHASGSKSLYFYGYSGSYYCYVALPTFEDSLSNLLVRFKLYKTSASYGGLTVGVMENTNDLSTFHYVASVQAQATSTWEEFTVPLGNYHGTGHITFLQNSTNYTYLDDVVVDFLPSCPPVSNLEVSNVNTTSAFVTWDVQPGVSPNSPVEYEVEVYEALTGNTVYNATDTNMFSFVTGLTALTNYVVKVRANCDADGYGDWDSVTLTTPCIGGGDIHITGNGTATTTYYLPLNNYYRYTYTQQIILASEMEGPTSIEGVRFNYNYSTAVTQKTNCTIYVGQTTLSTLSTSNFVDPSTLTVVYTGPMNVSNGWNTFNFTTPFNYDGTSNLVIAVDDNSNDYPGSAYVYNAYNCSATRSMYFYSDSQDPDPTSTSTLSAFTGSKSTASYRVDMKLVTPCDSSVTCVPPNVVVTNTGNNEATIYWGPGLDETSWDVDYRASDSSTWTSVGTQTDNHYTFTGLAPNVEYEFRVTANCSDTVMSTIVTTRTFCAPYAVPFHENFATFSTSTADPLPNCWEKHTNYSTNYPYASTSYSMSGGRSMYMYSSNTTYTYMVLPPFAAPVDSLQVSFWLYRTGTSYAHNLQVGIMTDPEDVNTFVPVANVAPTLSTVWEPFEIPLNTYEGTGQRIAIMSPNGVYSYPYLDELTVEYISPCPRVRNVASSGIGIDHARITWDTTSAMFYEIEYGPTGFVLGTGAFLSNIYDDSLTLTGLYPSTQYDVYVRGICGADTGNWSFAHHFYTACASIDSLPFFENFNHIGTGTSIHAPYCWTGSSSYSSSYPYPSTSYNRSGSGAAMYMYLYGTANYTMLQLPAIDTTALPINTVQVEFSLLKSNTTYDHGVVVGVCTGSGLTGFQPIDTFFVTAPVGVWQDFELPLNNFTGNGQYITFMSAMAPGYTYSYPYLDDIRLVPVPSCIRPDSLAAFNATSNSVDLQWRERGTATQWVVEYGPVGFTRGTGTAIVTSSNPVTITGLPTSYDGQFFVRSICEAGDTSDYSRDSCRFSTAQAPATIPYHIDFEDSTVWAGWQINSNNHIGWARGTATADSGNYSMYISPNGGLTYGNENFSSVVNASAYRDIDFGSTTSSFTISFRAKAGGTTTNTYDALMVFLVDPAVAVLPQSGNITSPWGNVNDLYTIAAVRLDTTWQTYQASFDTISGVHRVAFFWFNQNTGASYPYIGGPAAVDNIHIDYSPCARPVNLDVDTNHITSTTARLVWDGTPGVTYRVAYRVVGTSASTNQYVTSVTNSVTLRGLSPLTNYYAWVQAICDTDNASLFSDNVQFRTSLCDNAMVTAIGSENSTGSDYHAPVNNFYHYTLSETIIDSNELAGMSDIGYISYYYNYATPSTDKVNCTIYLQPTTKSSFSSTSDIDLLDTSVAVMVYTGPLNCTQGWNDFAFTTHYTYSGHGNLMVIVDDNSDAYDGSAYVFKTESCSSYRTITWYSDTYDADPTSSSYSGTKTYYQWRPVMKLTSCGEVQSCDVPIITGVTTTYNSATINWTGDGSTYQVNVKESSAVDWPATDITVTGNTYTFTGLTSSTNYTFRIRQDCMVDSMGYSDWEVSGFTTDELPCLPPDSLTVSNLTNAQGTFAWSPIGNESLWDLHVWFTGGLDTIYRVSTNPATVGGYTAGVTYSASIRAICGAEMLIGDWGDTITFTTQTCPNVSGLTSSSVTFNSVTLSWTAQTMAQSYRIEYGYQGFSQGTGTQVPVTTNTYTVTGLEDETNYDFYVKAVCATGWESEQWTHITVTTATAPTTTYTITTGVNNSAYGSVLGGGMYAENSTATLTAVPNTGYHFTQWQDGNTTNPRTITVTGNATYTAYFAADQYTVTATSADATMGSVTGGGTYSYGTTATLTATPNYGYHFTAWNDGNTDNPRTVTVTSDTALTAAFAANSYNVTVLSNDVTMGSVTGGGTYTYNSTATLTATALSGYNFRYWDDGNTSNPRLLTVTGDVTLTAVFSDDTSVVHNYTVTLSVNDPAMGSLTPAAGEYTYAEGTQLSITATANSGYHFVSWSDNVTDNPRTLTVTGDIALRADFEADIDSTAVLTVLVNDVTMGHVTINGQAVPTYTGRLGDQVTIAAEAYDHYQFVNWSDGDINAQRTYTLTESNATLTANFRSLEGIDGVDGNVTCTIYPNPTSDATTISVSGVSGVVRITVVDINGRTVRSETLECSGDCQKTMEVDGLAQGAYFVRITGETVNMVKKLVVR